MYQLGTGIHHAEPELSAEIYLSRTTTDWGWRPHQIQCLLQMVGEGVEEYYSKSLSECYGQTGS